MKYGLSEKQLQEIVSILSSYDAIEEAILFGSRAIDTYKEASDVDIAIKGKKANWQLATEIKNQLEEETYLPFLFDVVAYNNINNEQLLAHIDQKGKRIFSKALDKGWKVLKIKEFADVIGGGTPSTKKPEYWDGDIPWLTPRDLTNHSKATISKGARLITNEGLENSSAKLIPKDSVLLTSMAPIGCVAIAESEICTNQGFKSLVLDKSKADNYFILYWIRCNVKYLNQLGIGTTFAEISGSLIKEIEINLPPLPEQRAIAEVLSSLDDKIDLLHRQDQTLEKLAETLFRQWFVEPLKKAALERKNPKGFTKGTFSSWIYETVGGDWGKGDKQGEFTQAVNCIRGTDIADLNTGGVAKKTPIRFVKQKKFESIEPKNGDLLIEISGGTETQSTGRTTYINNDVKHFFNHPIVFSNSCRMIRVKKTAYSYFIYCYLQYLYRQNKFFDLENGSSGIKNLDYKELLFNLEFNMPEERAVVAFHSRVEVYFKKINRNKRQICTLEKLRDTLLPKLMSGDVTVVNPG